MTEHEAQSRVEWLMDGRKEAQEVCGGRGVVDGGKGLMNGGRGSSSRRAMGRRNLLVGMVNSTGDLIKRW